MSEPRDSEIHTDIAIIGGSAVRLIGIGNAARYEGGFIRCFVEPRRVDDLFRHADAPACPSVDGRRFVDLRREQVGFHLGDEYVTVWVWVHGKASDGVVAAVAGAALPSPYAEIHRDALMRKAAGFGGDDA